MAISTTVSSEEGAGRVMARCPVVGLGASPGAPAALRELFAHIPVDAGAAFVIVPSTRPEIANLPDPGDLLDLLRTHARLPVEEVRDGARVAPNRVYVAPAGGSLVIENGWLRVETAGARARPGIDAFLESLARDQGDLSVAIVLSDSGADGARGARAVEEHGGIVLVQAAETAGQDGSASAALAREMNQAALALPDLARTLVRHVAVTAAVCQGPRAMSAGVAEVPPEIWSVLRDATGRDLTGYKAGTVARRIARRMQDLGVDALSDYLKRLRSDPDEPQALLQQLLISVTAFFRDEPVFAALQERVLPRLVAEARGGELRAWVPGCATGEEAYSIAMLAHEAVERANVPVRVVVFATDLDARALEVARAGHYASQACAHIRPQRLARWFTPIEGGFAVTKSLRESCLFSSHHLTGDPPFSRLDLISCRNVLIYLENELKRLVLPVFHYALRPGGILLLGPSEGVGDRDALFATIDPKLRLFERTDAPSQPPPRFRFSVRATRQPPRRHVTSVPPSRNSVDQILLREFCPACAVVDSLGQVVNLSGPVGRFLELPQGPLASGLVDLVRDDLRLDVRTALHKAGGEHRTVARKRVTAHIEGRPRLVDLVVRPFLDGGGSEHFLVVFQEGQAPAEPAQPDLDEASSEALGRARAELHATKAHLQTTIDELETSNTRLQIANEEQVTVNEELQSANEELQTSQEELQSLNEELETVNSELSAKIEQLKRAEEALAESARRQREILEAIPHMVWTAGPDGGRDHFSRQWLEYTGVTEEELLGYGWLAVIHPEDREPILGRWREACRLGEPFETEVRIRRAGGAYRWFVSRAVPVRGADGRVARWFGSSTDIDERKQMEEALRETDRRKDEFLALLGHELRNPLAPLRNTVELLQRQVGDDGSIARALPVMRRQIAQLSRLVDDLLEIERIKRGKIALRRERVDLAALARAVLDDHATLFAESRLQVELTLPDSPIVTMGDPARLAQVLGNLLHNAAKFTDPGGEVSVALRRSRDGSEARLSVRDTGIGMDAPLLARAFEPFVQSSVAQQRRRPGLGLGLALVKSVVELHGGAVSVHSEGVGKGAEVIVTLPVEHVDRRPKAAEPSSSAPPAGRRVLVIDDNEDAAVTLADLLALEGHEVRVANDGPSGVEAGRAHRPDVVLCDLGLPGTMDGCAVARAFRADPHLARTFLVALSGYVGSEDQQRTRDAGFDRHVAKPASLETLSQLLRGVVPGR